MASKHELMCWAEKLLPSNYSFIECFGSSYPQDIRLFEAKMRSLWCAVPLLVSGFQSEKAASVLQECLDLVTRRQLPMLSVARRQIVVETASLSYYFGLHGKSIIQMLSPDDIDYLASWLLSVNDIDLPDNNWAYFRLLSNTALMLNGLPYSQNKIDEALASIDSLYLGNGWYRDGDTDQRDYYVSFAFHFYGLAYARLHDGARSHVFLERAREFAPQFLAWFDAEGRSLPFGRSLTYRFAHVSFWAMFVLSGAYRGSVVSLPVVRGVIERNIQFWRTQRVCDSSGILSVGYGYQNLLLSEDYNAPGSPFWAFKTFTILEIPQGHPFWSAAPAPLPPADPHVIQREAGFHIVSAPWSCQKVAFSAFQSSHDDALYHRQEKYGKFAYSSYFGFNLSRGSEPVRNVAIDSAIAFARDEQGPFIMRGDTDESLQLPAYSVIRWHVQDCSVLTYLVPIGPNVHARIHEILSACPLVAYEGGFPLMCWDYKSDAPRIDGPRAAIENEYGLCAIRDLSGGRCGELVRQGPNTNLYSCERNAVPALKARLDAGSHVLCSVVFGAPGSCRQELDVFERLQMRSCPASFDLTWPGGQVHVDRMDASSEISRASRD